jgi:hypothetical protein
MCCVWCVWCVWCVCDVGNSRVCTQKGDVRQELLAQITQLKFQADRVIWRQNAYSVWIDVVPAVESVSTSTMVAPVRKVLESYEVDCPTQAVELHEVLEDVSCK